MNLVCFDSKDVGHQKSGVWAAEEGFVCLRTSVLIRMRLAQQKVDSLYNMVLPLCCRICFHEEAISEQSCHVLSGNLWCYSYPLAAATSNYTDGSLPRDGHINLFHQEIFLTLIPFSSRCTKTFPSSREVLIVSCTVHFIKNTLCFLFAYDFGKTRAELWKWFSSSSCRRSVSQMEKQWMQSCGNLLRSLLELETWIRSSCFELSFSDAAAH